ncbi:hypothetical protein [Rhodococcoides corynebacterioides]|uniref:GNAT family N-acetyltransferase n=1 Tax=Rhodococcoides corynebacterioides TaxID=53972 RepID=A0ABS7NZG0_9NOCA|nr:hypothetical protein [Rhodococcus corynebacterioides]MBY6365518.1 hypothetical protein [Rhodococcus corynebacterioides]MBY6408626.1 hypothetical protein [Rhodococcus corynebacterioides]
MSVLVAARPSDSTRSSDRTHAAARPRDLARPLSRGATRLDDRASGTTLVMSTPSMDRALWEDYLDAADVSYSRHGVSIALDAARVRDGRDTAVFFAAVDASGTVVGGVRGQGPYLSAQQSHALVEWAGNADRPRVEALITDRLPHGVVEMKSAFVSTTAEAPGALSALLSRTALPTMVFTGARFVMATAADHVLRRWESGGGRVTEAIAPAAYPDERYRTRMMWWDRDSLDRDVAPEVWDRIAAETEMLTGRDIIAA